MFSHFVTPHPQRSPSPSNHSDVGGESWQDSSPSSPRNQSIRSPTPSSRSPSPSSSHSGNHRGGSRPGGPPRASNSQSIRTPSPSSSHSGNHRGGSHPGGSSRSSNSQSMRSPSPSPRNHRGSRPGGSPLASNSIRARSPRERNSVFPMENDKFQRCVMKKLVEIMEVVKRIEADHQRGGTYLLKTMLTMDEVLMLEDKLNQEEERQALLAQLSKVGGEGHKRLCCKNFEQIDDEWPYVPFQYDGPWWEDSF
ncbi:hypothetical protein AALO_G00095210 [Alosa alosa]|uniref:Uncharacterized protein n=1 Tax=Alosa alosa TaxID=278164 RepID=A0AAV6GW16_9TELE|nr:hypothetical protein AALO_G00095210 [Alosa alosa]